MWMNSMIDEVYMNVNQRISYSQLQFMLIIFPGLTRPAKGSSRAWRFPVPFLVLVGEKISNCSVVDR